MDAASLVPGGAWKDLEDAGNVHLQSVEREGRGEESWQSRRTLGHGAKTVIEAQRHEGFSRAYARGTTGARAHVSKDDCGRNKLDDVGVSWTDVVEL